MRILSRIVIPAVTIGIFLCISSSVASAAFWHKNGSGKTEQRSYKLSGFDTVEVSGEFDLELKPEGDPIELSIDSNLFDDITIDVADGKLMVSSNWRIKPTVRPQLRVNSTKVREVNTTGSVTSLIKVAEEIKEFKLDLTGSSQAMIVDASFRKLNITATGSSHAVASGQVDYLTLLGTGSMHGAFENLAINTADISCSGSVTLRFGEVNAISGHVSGGSSVTYRKPPKQADIKIN